MAEHRPAWFSQVDDVARAHAAWAHMKALDMQQKGEQFRDRLYEAIYLNRSLAERGPYRDALRLLSKTGLTATRLNVVRSKLDTITNKVAKQPAHVRINPDNADYSLKRRARNLRQFLHGKWQENNAQLLNQQVFRDGGIVKSGVVKVVNEFGDIKLERTRKRQILVDAREARDGRPRQAFQKDRVPREVLLEKFATDTEAVARIRGAERAAFTEEDAALGYSATNVADLIEVGECWHLPSGPAAKDGWHGLFIHSGPLRFRPWTRCRFPFARFHWAPPFDGYWGATSLVEDLADIQWKINETVRDIQHDLFFAANTHILAQRGANIDWSHYAKRRGVVVVEFDGMVEPKVITPNAINPGKLEFLNILLQQAEESVGVPNTAQAARSQVGAGASGVAHQEQEDRESERHYDKDLALTMMWRELAEICIDEAKDIEANEENKLSSVWLDGSFMRKIAWKEVDMERDQFTIQPEPANFLPDTRAGKLEATDKLAQQGVIKGAAIPALYDFPDLREVMLEITAPRDAILRLIEVLDDKDRPMPSWDPHLDMELLDQLVRAYYNHAVAEEADGKTLKRYRDFMALVTEEKKKKRAAMAPPPGGPGLLPEMGGLPPEMGLAGPGGALPPAPAPTTLPGQALPGL